MGEMLNPKVVYLYNTQEAVLTLHGLSLATTEVPVVESLSVVDDNIDATNIKHLTVSNRMSCAACSVTFDDRSQQVGHFSSDWHRYNLKQKLRGIPAVSEETFQDITDDVSSISGSESDSDEDKTRQGALVHEKPPSATQDYSDSESYHVEGIGRRHPRVFLRSSTGELVSVYRAVVHCKKNQPETEHELVSMVTALPKQTKWLILMLAGGHFAGAVVDGEHIVCHKTFHRYVVRAKGGTVQSARDKQGNAPKSVGAYLRRHHEAALGEDIKQQLVEWVEHVKSCDRIFLRATGSARQMFFNTKAPLLDKHDHKIRVIPFPTRRPTLNELKRVWQVLATVNCYGTQSEISDHIKTRSPKKYSRNESPETTELNTASPRLRSKKPEQPTAAKCQDLPYIVEEDSSDSDAVIELGFSKELVDLNQLRSFEDTTRPRRQKKKKNEAIDTSEEPKEEAIKEDLPIDPFADVDLFYGLKNEVYTAVKTGDADALEKWLLELNDLATRQQIPTDVSLNRSVNDSGMRLLHLACREGHKACVRVLLTHGANPEITDSSGSLPYIIAKQKTVRNEFRKFRADFPDKYDYARAQIPGALSEEKEHEKRTRDMEKRKTARKAKNARLKDQREEEHKLQAEEQQRQRFLHLSDREKRALAAEKRLSAQAQSQGVAMPAGPRCFQCAADMAGKVPFEYSDNIFCAPKCLQAHRKSQQIVNKSTKS